MANPDIHPFFTFFFQISSRSPFLWEEDVVVGRPTHQLWGRAVDGCFEYSTMGLQFLRYIIENIIN